MITWIRQAIGLAVFGFINLVLFIALSNPFGMILDTIDEEAENMGVDSQVTPFIDSFRMIFGATFVLSMLGLMIWVFMNAHKSEFEQY